MKTLHSLMLALPLLAGSGVALADRDHGHDRHGERDHRGHGHRDEHRHAAVRHHDRYRHWERGHRYGGPIYVVHDYGHYRLRPPPRGYGWVRAENNDYLLVALTTGIILDIATR
ncbi:RcnB family protein [Rhodanobacter sp. Si-c]|uniref:RcnB family protein n=1 Tax=Rhodanobacter lycopersici TaxID=3162487 RepID=A0ABV3QIV4_9GAMM